MHQTAFFLQWNAKWRVVIVDQDAAELDVRGEQRDLALRFLAAGYFWAAAAARAARGGI